MDQSNLNKLSKINLTRFIIVDETKLKMKQKLCLKIHFKKIGQQQKIVKTEIIHLTKNKLVHTRKVLIAK